MRKISLTAILASVFFIFFVFYFSLKNEKTYDTTELIGKPLPENNLNIMGSENLFNTQNLSKNDFTLINFWASWCGPCRKEHKNLIHLSQKVNLKILGINFKDDLKKAKIFLDELGNPYYILAFDKDGKKSINFGVYGIPETILINSDLVILKKYIGPIDINDIKEIKKITGR